MLMIIVSVFMVDLTVVNSLTLERGVAYPEDILIGPKTLFTKGSILEPNPNPSYPLNYTLTLLPVEGKITSFVNTYGYLAGFQWYNTEKGRSNRGFVPTIEFQIYRYKGEDNNGVDPPLGEYELVKETDSVLSEPGFNEVYFHEGLAIKPGLDYYIGMKAHDSAGVPVLYEECDGSETYLQLHGLTSCDYYDPCKVPIIFTESSIKGCAHFSMQAIFVPTMAASEGINCTFKTAKLRNADYMYYPRDHLFLTEKNNHTECWIIRADRKDRTLVVMTSSFEFVNHYGNGNKQCNERTNVKMQEFEKLEGTSAEFVGSKLWGYYCGTYNDIFRNRETSLPYFSVVATTTDTYGYLSFSVYAMVEEYEELKIGLGITFTVLVIIDLVILTIWCTRATPKQSTTDSEPLTGTSGPVVPVNTAEYQQPAPGAVASSEYLTSASSTAKTTTAAHDNPQQPQL